MVQMDSFLTFDHSKKYLMIMRLILFPIIDMVIMYAILIFDQSISNAFHPL